MSDTQPAATPTETGGALGVAMIGHGFMGAAHSQAWRVAPAFFDLPLAPRMVSVVGRDRARTQESADRWGWDRAETDWRAAIERDDIDVVDICSPGSTHVEIAVAALEAGKHVLCEKPLGTRSRRRRSWRPPPRRPPRRGSARWSASATAACPPSRSRATSSPRAPSASSARCARSTCRTG